MRFGRPSWKGAKGALIGICGILAGCAREPVALIPAEQRVVLAYDGQPSVAPDQTLTIDQLLARARGETGTGPHDSRADPSLAPESGAKPTLENHASVGSGSAGAKPSLLLGGAGAARNPHDQTLVLDMSVSPSGPDAASRARIAAVAGRFPPTTPPASLTIGPAGAGDPIAGLARAQRYAEAVVDLLPAPLRPVRLDYRPDLPPDALVIEFAPAVERNDG